MKKIAPEVKPHANPSSRKSIWGTPMAWPLMWEIVKITTDLVLAQTFTEGHPPN